MICPKCKAKVENNSNYCVECGFDIALYNEAYIKIYNQKLQQLNSSKPLTLVHSNQVSDTYNQVHKPRCPYCNSDNLTKITSFDRAVNAAVFGILGNKRKYQWHCNNCKTNW